MNKRARQLAAAVLAFGLSFGTSCGDDESEARASDPSSGAASGEGSDATPEGAKGPSTPSQTVVGDAPQLGATRVVAHDAGELQAAGALAQARSLDLALSLVDARTRPIDPDAPLPESDQCAGVDLMKIAATTPRLERLRISGCPALVRAGLQSFSQISHLELADLVLDDVTIARISQLPRLRSLTLTRVQATEASTTPMVRTLKIQRIKLKELERDSTIADLLGDLPTLTEVRLEGGWAGHRAMLSLGHAKRVRRLELVDTSVSNYSLNQIKLLTALQEVRWVGPTFNDNSPLYLRDLPVRSFFCECSSLGDQGIRHLRYVPAITDLHIERSRVSPGGLAALVELEGLKHLFLGDQDINNESLAAIARLPKLQTLRLEGGTLLEPGPEVFAALTKLSALSLHIEDVDDESIASLEALTELEELWLGGSQLTDDGLASLSGLAMLTKLELSHTRVTNKGIEHIAKLTGLRELYLDHTDLVDSGAQHLRGLTRLETLDLSHTLITDASIDVLLDLPALRKLGLAATVVSELGASRLNKLPSLRLVDLSGSRAAGDPGL